MSSVRVTYIMSLVILCIVASQLWTRIIGSSHTMKHLLLLMNFANLSWVGARRVLRVHTGLL